MSDTDPNDAPNPLHATILAETLDEASVWRRRFERERKARREAEALLESFTRDLFDAKNHFDAQRAFLDSLLDHAEAYFFVKDEEGRFEYVNQKSADMFGLPKESIMGRLQTDLLPPDLVDEFQRTDRRIFDHGERIAGPESIVDNGVSRTLWTIKAPLDLGDGTRRLVGFSTDVSELEALREELADLAIRDSVTGVLNHRAFRQAGERICQRALTTHSATALLVIDIDHFKRINDEHGHGAGDEVLHAVAQHMQGHARETDVFARVGGEEFAFLLPETTLEHATALAERLVTTTRDLHVDLGEARVTKPTISIGVTACPPEEEGIDEAFRRADRALYRAKAEGRDRWLTEA